MKNLPFSFSLLLLVFLTGGCRQGIKSQDPAGVQIEKVKVADYGRALFALDPMNIKPGLDSLSDQFHFFIGDNPDTLNMIQIREFIMDPFNRELANKCMQVYPDLVFLEDGLTGMFGRVKTNYPGFKVPAVYSYISGLLYESPVEYLDSVMIIGLDMFLGWDFEQYRAAGLPVYMTKRMEPQNILPECARQVAFSLLPEDVQPKTLLDYMILHGKILYAMDVFLPATPDSLKIGYTKSQSNWCNENEASVWRLFIDQEMLYKSDEFLNNRFIQDGPFTAGLPEGSPAMLGRWIGWQIVRSYMKKNSGTDLSHLFELDDAQQILSQSGYKPKK
ncbi:MAG: hypothetical protein HGA23_00610 [Bacteroidales bacterium]|nr:hypothetical protein [Bacteroidales bacterium]